MKTRHRRGLYAPELLESRIAPATFIVTNLSDADPDSLRDAITKANNNDGPDTIKFQIPAAMLPGTIHLTSAEIAITDPVTITGSGVDLITVSGNDARRIFKIDYPVTSTVPTVITGLTLVDGKSTAQGGAIFSVEPLTLKNVVISSSEAATIGGGVAVDTDGKVSIDSCKIINNKATNTSGGLYLAANGGISIVRSTIASNTAKAAGGLYAHIPSNAVGPASIVLDKVIVTGNSATAGPGGGMSLEGIANGKVEVKNSLISGNSATDRGGALYLDDGALIVKKTTFSGNTALKGGAIAAQSALSIDISGSRFLGNAAAGAGAAGGALYLQGTPAKIAATIFSGNSAATDGGAIATSAAGSPVMLDIKGSSFLGNTASGNGGAVFVQNKTALTLKSSVLSGNVAGMEGGAIAGETASSITATGNKFTENHAASAGGAIRAFGHTTAAVPLTLAGNLFSANTGDRGGAVYALGDGAVSMKGDKVLGNLATVFQGGGLYLTADSASITLTGLLVQGNVAAGGAGGLLIGSNATVTGCKVLDNAANVSTGKGGGIWVTAGTVVISKSTISGNAAAAGGGLYDGGNTTIPGTKIFGNSARVDPNTSGI